MKTQFERKRNKKNTNIPVVAAFIYFPLLHVVQTVCPSFIVVVFASHNSHFDIPSSGWILSKGQGIQVFTSVTSDVLMELAEIVVPPTTTSKKGSSENKVWPIIKTSIFVVSPAIAVFNVPLISVVV